MEKVKKASLDDLNALHSAVANHLSENLNEAGVLQAAIRFLKDNNITASLGESKETKNLNDKINELVKASKKDKDIENSEDNIFYLLEQAK